MTTSPRPHVPPGPRETLLEYRVRRGWRRACHLAAATSPRLDGGLLSRMEHGRRSPHGEAVLAAFWGLTDGEMEALVGNGRLLR